MPRRDGQSMNRHNSRRAKRGAHSGRKHSQAFPRRGHGRTYPFRPWATTEQGDGAVAAAKAAVQHADWLTSVFDGTHRGGGDQ